MYCENAQFWGRTDKCTDILIFFYPNFTFAIFYDILSIISFVLNFFSLTYETMLVSLKVRFLGSVI